MISTNERLDDFAKNVDRRFDEVDRCFEAVDKRFERLERRMEYGFEQVDKRLMAMTDRIDHFSYVLIGSFAALVASTLGGFIALFLHGG
jgi:hypothetical protein